MPALVFIGDLHVGSTVGLCPQKLITTAEQAALFENWRDLCSRIKSIKGGYNLMLGGDTIEGHHHNTRQVWGDIKEQRDAAIDLLMPLAGRAKTIWGVHGTDTHTGSAAENDRQVYKELGAKSSRVNAVHSLKINGDEKQRLWWSHHGAGVGANKWTESNKIATIAKNAALAKKPPRWIVFHHSHVSPHPVTIDGVTAAITPCWQMSTSYGWQISPHRRPTIGALIIHNGEMSIIRYDEVEKEQSID